MSVRSKAAAISFERREKVATMTSVITLITMAYSAMVWPDSAWNLIGSFIIVTTFLFVWACTVLQVLQDPDDAGQGAVDRAGESEQRANDDERDHGENDAVLGHRLTFIVPKGGEAVLE